MAKVIEKSSLTFAISPLIWAWTSASALAFTTWPQASKWISLFSSLWWPFADAPQAPTVHAFESYPLQTLQRTLEDSSEVLPLTTHLLRTPQRP